MQPIAPRRGNRAKCSYRPTRDCPRLTRPSHAIQFFPPIGHITSCVPRATWWRCDSYEYRLRDARAGTLCTRHNRHHATLGTQSTNSMSTNKIKYESILYIFFYISMVDSYSWRIFWIAGSSGWLSLVFWQYTLCWLFYYPSLVVRLDIWAQVDVIIMGS